MRRKASVFRIPIAIGLVSFVGLIAALLEDGPYDWVSWFGLSVPVAVIVWARLRRAS